MRSAWREARELVYQHRRRLIAGLGLMLVSRTAGLVPPLASKQFIDRVVGLQEFTLLTPLAIAITIATIVQASTGFALSQVLGIAAQRATMDIRRNLHAHVLRLPVRQFDATQVGTLVSRIMNDAEGLRNLIGSGFVQLLGGGITAGASLLVLFYVSWKITLVILGTLLVFGGGLVVAFSRLRPVFRERNRLVAEVMGRLAQSLSGIRIVKSYVAERREDAAFTRGIHRIFRTSAKAITGWSLISTLTILVIGAIAVVMVLMGGEALRTGEATLGDLAMYVLFTGLVAAPLLQVAQIGTQIAEAFAGLDRIRELMSLATEDEEDRELTPAPTLIGAFRFEDVSFSYGAGPKVLSHLAFVAPAGTTTALVGPSGAGKSTLLSLIAAFARPTDGRIIVDGMDLASLRLRDYRRQVGVVLQENFLFDGTVLNNIKFSRPDATLDEVRAVARLSHCEEFILRFPNGYDTVVGERGVRMSGGQRQRLAIARALLADPAILLLDEATSHLDTESEALVQAGLQALRRGRTSFVIAHRLSTVVTADQILLLTEGRIADRGTHQELMARNAQYRGLYARQMGLNSDRIPMLGP